MQGPSHILAGMFTTLVIKMLKRINDFRRLAQAQFVLVFFSLLFCFLAFAGMNFFDPNGGLPYPSDNVIIITENLSKTDSGKFYTCLEEIANTEQLTIIKNVLNDGGEIRGYVFGSRKNTFNNDKVYTRDQKLLKSTTVEGSYYVVGNMPPNRMQSLREMNLKFEIFNTPIWLVAVSFLTGGDLYSLSFFVLLLMFFVVSYALLVIRLKEAVIERSFGIFQSRNFNRFLKSLVTIVISFAILGIIISAINDYFATVKVKAFFLTLAMIVVLLFILQIIAYTVFLWQVMTANISDIQKNKLSGKKIQVVWLIVIALSTVLLTHETSVISKNYPKYLSQKHLVKEWQPAENYARIWWSFLDNDNLEGNSAEKNEQMKLDNQNMRNFANCISSDDVLISKLANEQASWFGKVDVYVEGKGAEIRAVNPQIAEKIYIVNPQVLKLNREIHPESQYQVKSDKAVTVFIPEKYRKDLSEIKLIALRGLSDVVSDDEVDWQFIPNRQEIFLFMLESESNLSLPDSDRKDMILIDLDWGKLPKNEKTDFLIGNFTFDAMYDARGLQKKLADNHLIQKVNHFQNVKMSLQNTVNDLNRQFISSISLILVMFLLQLLGIYDFLKMQIQLNGKQIIIRTLNGLGFRSSVYRHFASLLVTLSLLEVVCWFWLGTGEISLILITVYLLAILLIYFGAFRQLHQNKLSILKGGDIS